MSSNDVKVPFPTFFDTAGEPLNNGYIYIGLVNQNPETTPLSVYWDEALSIPISQPVRTLNGYPSYNGTPANIFTTAIRFSITVRDKNGNLVYTDLSFDTSSSIIGQYLYTDGASQSLASSSTQVEISEIIETVFFNSSKKQNSGSKFQYTGTTTSAKAGNCPDADGYFYDADGKQFKPMGDEINALIYGVAVDGVTDDTTALTRALVYVAIVKGVLRLPIGTMVVSQLDLSSYQDIAIKGSLPLEWTDTVHGSCLKANTATQVINFQPVGSRVNARITLEDIFVDGTSTATDAFKFDNFSVITLHRCVAIDVDYGFNVGDTNNSFGVDIEGCYVNNPTFQAYRISARLTEMRYNASDGGAYSINVTDTGGQSVFIGNNIEGASTATIQILAANCRVVGNNITAPSAASVGVQITGASADYNIVANNRISRNGAAGSVGIYVTNISNIITGNTITDVELGISLATNQTIVCNNEINASTTAISETTPGGANYCNNNIIVSGAMGLTNSLSTAYHNWGVANKNPLVTATLAAGNNNDYALDAGAEVFGASGDSGGTSVITGIAGGTNGRKITIINRSVYDIAIANEDANSSAANRIRVPNYGLTLDAYSSMEFVYLSIEARWYAVGQATLSGAGYQVSNLTIDRVYDANATSTAELADVLGTLIQDLTKAGIVN